MLLSMEGQFEIYKQLAGDEVSREILRFCESPKSTEEIMKDVFRYYRYEKGYDWYKKVEDIRDAVGARLYSLGKIDAISYDASQNKWKTQEIALSVMKKYFGM